MSQPADYDARFERRMKRLRIIAWSLFALAVGMWIALALGASR